MTCPFGCSAGACLPDPCAGVTCTTPPTATCVAGPAVRTWASPGTCSSGSCSYAPTDAPCSGTANGTATCTGAVCGIACSAGFELVGTGGSATCADIDECADATTCGADVGAGTCVDTTGGYQCFCSSGHGASGTGLSATCVDDDECAVANGGCPTGASCTNAPGTFACACPPGTTECTGACVDTEVDPAHCGGCGNALAGAQYCVDGAPVSAPQVSQVSSALAETADAVVLEGTFGASAAVTIAGFPATSVSALAAGRLRVEVPASASAGDIVVTTGGATATWGTFRRVGFSLGLGEFRSEYEQEGYGRQMPFLASPRSHATSIATPRWWYVVGGSSTAGAALRSVERAMVNADGTVGELQDAGMQLVTGRSKAAGVRVGGWFYVVGGASGATPLGSVERAALNTDGTLGTFATFGASTLVAARSGHAAVVLGGYLYVLGGAGAGGAALASVERAPILAGGALGAFTPHWASLTTPRDGAAAFATDTHLFVVGGRSGSTQLASVEAAPLGATLGAAPTAFAAAGTLGSGGRSHARALRVGTHVFLVGGAGSGGPLTTVEELMVSGAPPTVVALPAGGPLQATREAPAVAIVGNHAYVAGGVSSGGTLDTVERAALNTSGDLGTRAVLTNAIVDQVRLGTTRSYAAIGPYLYLLGGGSGGNGVCASGPWPVLRWPVDAAGGLGPVETMPYSVGGVGGSVVITGSTVCVAPGRQGASASTSAVYCAAIGADASLGPFNQESTLLEAPEGLTFIALRSWVVRLTPLYSGGTGIGGAIHRAPLTAGLPGAFVTTGVNMPAPTLCHSYGTPVMLGPEFHGLGGYLPTGTQSARIDRVVFDALGNPTAPTIAAVSGGAPQYLSHAALVGPYVYAVGGGSPPRTSMTRARLAMGAVPSHTAYGGAALATGRQSGGAIALGNYLYVLGGYDGTGVCNTVSGSNPDVEQFVLR